MSEYLDDQQVADKLGVCVRTLTNWLRTLPAGLPGEPILVGAGSVRARRRWRADRLDEFLVAANAARPAAPAKVRGAPPSPASSPKVRKPPASKAKEPTESLTARTRARLEQR